MLGFQRLAGMCVWGALVVIQWLHASFIAIPVQWWLDNVVTTAEETTKATMREYFSLFGRVINGIASWLVAIFVDRDFFKNRHRPHSRGRAWKKFWKNNKQGGGGGGTLNAVIEQEGLIASSSRREAPVSPLSAAAAIEEEEGAHFTPRRIEKNQSPQSPFLSPSPSQQQQSLSTSSSSTIAWWWPFNLFFSSSSSSSTSKRSSNKRLSSASASSSSSFKGMKRSGSDLFNRPAGFAVAEKLERRGLSDSLRIGMELTIEAVFSAFRSFIVSALFLRKSPIGATAPSLHHHHHQSPHGKSYPHRYSDDDFPGWWSEEPARKRPLPTSTEGTFPRTQSFGSWEDMGVWTASDAILQAGYPLEEHVVVTSDGYILSMQRIPRKDAKDVVFFQHGIFDTALGWVSNGTQGSQAFAAFDRGADVWLGNCRANPPRAHADASRSGAAYWCYSINELGMEDVAAQIFRIHAVKTAELGSSRHGGGGGGGFAMASVVGGDGSGAAAAAAAAALGGGGGVTATSVPSPEVVTAAAELPSSSSSSLSAAASLQTGGALHYCNSSSSNNAAVVVLPSPRTGLHKRSGSDSVLTAQRNITLATERMAEGEGGASVPPNEENIKAHHLAALAAAAAAAVAKANGVFGKKRNTKKMKNGDGGDGSSSSSAQQKEEHRSNRRSLDSLSRMMSSPSPLAVEELSGGGGDSALLSTSFSTTRLDSSGEGQQQQTMSNRGSETPPHVEMKEKEDENRMQPSPFMTAASHFVDRCVDEAAAAVEEEDGVPLATPPPPPPSARQHNFEKQGIDVLTTPDRVFADGKEQPPLQWARASDAILPPLQSRQSQLQSQLPELYRLQAIGHSLGGASLLIYAVMCRVLGRPHHLSRLVLLSPGGFHSHYPKIAAPFLYIVPFIIRLLNRFRPGVGAPTYIPSSLLRYITFKLTVDLQQVPALNELLRAGLRLLLNGDASEWDRALQMPHYTVSSMPAISLHTGCHLMQLMSTGKFLLYDYGSVSANRKHYGSAEPPDVAAHYHLLTGLPVDLVAGASDGVIAREDVEAHYDAMKAAGLEVSLKEFNVGHLDVTFAVKHEVQHYVLSRLKIR